MDKINKPKILVVDDAVTNRMIMERILIDEYSVISAKDGKQAFDILMSDDISLVLLDLVMPVMDGFALMDKIKENPKICKIPIIVISAIDDEDSQMRALSAGASEILAKPFNSKLLKLRIKNILDRIRFNDISAENETFKLQLEHSKQQLYIAEHDSLTGLFCRNAFINRVSDRVYSAKSASYMMICVDIDKYKMINEVFGIETGDMILKRIADKIQSESDKWQGICCRDKADAFLMFLPNEKKSVEFICNEVSDSLNGFDLPSVLSAHFGIYVCDDLNIPAAVMIDRSVKAMRSVKNSLSVKYAFFSDEMLDEMNYRQNVIRNVEKAINENQFELMFLPKIDLIDNSLIGAEAFLNWNNPKFGTLSPNEYISLLEESGHIFMLDNILWDGIFNMLKKWKSENLQLVPISFKLSHREIIRTDLGDEYDNILKSIGLDKSFIRIIISERGYINDPKGVVNFASRLRKKGFKIAFCDFGSGKATFNALKDIEIDGVRINSKIFLENDRNKNGERIISAFVQMAKDMNIEIVANDVKNREQAKILSKIGCSHVLGSYKKNALTADEFEKMLKNQ